MRVHSHSNRSLTPSARAASRGIAVRALVRVAPRDQVLAKDLASRLNNESDYVRMAILDALEEMGGAAEPALDEIRRLAEDSTGIVRARTMGAVAKISASSGEKVANWAKGHHR